MAFERMTAEEYRARFLGVGAEGALAMRVRTKKNKYGAVRTKVDGIWFDSAWEARRYGALCLLVRAGTIRDLSLQPEFALHAAVDGEKVPHYVGDFQYFETGPRSRGWVCEDAKGKATPLYRLKIKLARRMYPDITFIETRQRPFKKGSRK